MQSTPAGEEHRADHPGKGARIMDGLKRVGVTLAVVVLIGIGKFTVLKPSPNQDYFNKMAALDKQVGDNKITDPSVLRGKVNALPIQGVTDPKLQEYHATILQFLDAIDQKDATKVA